MFCTKHLKKDFNSSVETCYSVQSFTVCKVRAAAAADQSVGMNGTGEVRVEHKNSFCARIQKQEFLMELQDLVVKLQRIG